MIDRLTAVSLIGGLCFAAALPLELRSHVTKPTASPSPVAKAEDVPAGRTSAPAIKQLVTTSLARPLFSAARRPPDNEQDGHMGTSLADLRLTGILIMPDQHFAIFAKSDGKQLVRSEGEMISDWHIDNIGARSIFLSGPSGTTSLEPKADPNLARLQSAAQPSTPVPPPTANSPPLPASNAPVRPAPVLRSER
ncbi:MAG: hypothetical protein WAV02_02450 [Stellaceae bacterium]